MKKIFNSRFLAALAAGGLVLFVPQSDAQAAKGKGTAGSDIDRDGILNGSDPDVDNDGLSNGSDPNVDGGVALSGPLVGTFVGDKLLNGDLKEKDIDGDGLNDDAGNELDIDGDGLLDDDAAEDDIDGDGLDDDDLTEYDIDGDGKLDDSKKELDIDGDGLFDDDINEDDTDGDGLDDDDLTEDDIDGDGLNDDDLDEDDIDGDGNLDDSPSENDIDGDGLDDADDSDSDGDGLDDDSDDDNDGDGIDDEFDFDDDDGGNVGVPGGVVGDGLTPASLSGLSYLVSDGDDAPETLEFLTATTGRQVETLLDIDAFTYTLEATADPAVGLVKVYFKPDKYDEYTLNFSNGTYARREIDRGLVKKIENGTFALVTP